MPHVCGDEPGESTAIDINNYVCPTYVGMNRTSYSCKEGGYSMPHVCGDDPAVERMNTILGDVCPTYVGMNRLSLP